MDRVTKKSLSEAIVGAWVSSSQSWYSTDGCLTTHSWRKPRILWWLLWWHCILSTPLLGSTCWWKASCIAKMMPKTAKVHYGQAYLFSWWWLILDSQNQTWIPIRQECVSSPLTQKLQLKGLSLAWAERAYMNGMGPEAVQLSYLLQLPMLQGWGKVQHLLSA